MEPIKFDGANVIYGANQPECIPLPAFRKENGEIWTCWKLSPEDLKQIQETGVIWLSMLTFNQPLQPVLLSPDFPYKTEPVEISDEIIRCLTE